MSKKKKAALGIDIGGTGIKAAIVDVEEGVFLSERFRFDTPKPSTPKAIAEAVLRIVNHFQWKGCIGVGFPAIVKKGVAYSAANIHKKWVGVNVEALFLKTIGQKITVVNDADAAGAAAVKFGAGKGKPGVVLFLTIGTGIGSALFLDGKLLPNTEFGHLFIDGKIAEKQVSNAVRKNQNLSMEDWGKRLSDYLNHLERTVSPDWIILGGGGGKKFAEFADYLKLETPIVPSILENNAGIIGAAYEAYLEQSK